MKTQTSLTARQYRLKEWAQMIRDCKPRPVNMTVDEWCAANSITKANYYYRMTQVRQACLDSFSEDTSKPAVVPVPMKMMSGNESQEVVPDKNNSSIELISNGVTIRVTEQTSTELLSKVLGVITHVE